MSKNECEFQALLCEREAMLAANRQREHLGQAMAYHDASFTTLAKAFRDLAASMDPPADGELQRLRQFADTYEHNILGLIRNVAQRRGALAGAGLSDAQIDAVLALIHDCMPAPDAD